MKTKKFNCLIEITKVQTGEKVTYQQDIDSDQDEDAPNLYLWEFGNYSCDCNRELELRRNNGWYNESEPRCGTERYKVKISNQQTGQIYYDETTTETP